MAEPTADDLAAARAVAVGYCGWHVTPVEESTVTVDGPGSPLLTLPTLKLIELSAVSELGVDLDVDTLSAAVDGRVRKRDMPYWYDVNWFGPTPAPGWWTGEYSSITVTMTHGYTAEEAADFEAAVRLIAGSLTASTIRDDSTLIEKQVDDVRYKWAEREVETIVGRHLLARFKIDRTP